MTDKVINFRQGKKRLARAAKEITARENRVRFGRTKAQKQADAAKAQKATKHIDDHKREP